MARTAFAAHTYNEAFKRLGAHPRLIDPVSQMLDGNIYMHQFKLKAKAAFDGAVWSGSYIHPELPMLEPVDASVVAVSFYSSFSFILFFLLSLFFYFLLPVSSLLKSFRPYYASLWPAPDCTGSTWHDRVSALVSIWYDPRH